MAVGRGTVVAVLALAAACGDDLAPADGAGAGERIVRVGDVDVVLDLSGTTPYPGPCTAQKIGRDTSGECTYRYTGSERLASIEFRDTATPEEITTDRMTFGWQGDDLATIDVFATGMGCAAIASSRWTASNRS